MRIHSNGRVSIGSTTASANTLTLSGSATEMDMTNTSTNGRSYRIESDSAGLFVIKDRTANADRIVLNSSGNVGIGTDSPTNRLHVNSATDNTVAVFESTDTEAQVNFKDTTGIASIRARADFRFYSGNTELVRFTTAGAVGIGVSSSSGSRMHVKAPSGTADIIVVQTGSGANTNVGAIVFRDSTFGYCGQITVNGSTNTTNYLSASDYRLKQDYQDFNGLDLVSDIPVYDFQWKKSGTRAYGVQAHELQEVLPQAVVGEKDAQEMQGVDYSKIVPILLKSIQELKARIEILENN